MSIPTWGMLEKSQEDNETIEEAIARLITAHLADSNAHLGAGESLTSHRASEIIDHLALSIVEDKIAERNVTIDHLEDFGSMWRLSLPLETLDGWSIYTSGGATVQNNVGKMIFSVPYNANPNYYATAYAITKTVLCDEKIHTRIIFETAYDFAGYTAYICTGIIDLAQTGSTAMGFKVVDGVLYAYHKGYNLGDPVEHTTEVMNLAANTFYNFECIYTPSTSIEFYVNDVLVATHTNDLPPEAIGFGGAFYIKETNNTTGTKGFNIYSPYIQQKI